RFGVLYPAGVVSVRLVVPAATAWNVVDPELPVTEIGLTTVPIVVSELAIGTCTVTPGRNGCNSNTSSVPGSSTAEAMPTAVLLPTLAVKLFFVRTNPELNTVTVTIASVYPGACTVKVVVPGAMPCTKYV